MYKRQVLEGQAVRLWMNSVLRARLILVMVPLVLSALRITTQMNFQEVEEMAQVANGVLVQMEEMCQASYEIGHASEEMGQASEEMDQTSPMIR